MGAGECPFCHTTPNGRDEACEYAEAVVHCPWASMSEKQDAIQDRLLTFYTLEETRTWWRSPAGLLNGRRPINCPPADVLKLILLLESGAYI